MKFKVYVSSVLISATALVSCSGNDDKEVVDKSIIPTASETAASQPAAPNTATAATVAQPVNAPVIPGTVNPANVTPVNITPQTTPLNINPQNNTVITAPQTMTQTAVQAPTAPGMNPPHGQPNHRCDIAVGAPLNSKPAPTATTVNAQPQQPQVTMKEVPNAVKTAPGMNPPHGEPNHRCDIAVGAPLNSKPATPVPAPAQVVTAPPSLLAAPKTDSSKN